MKNRWVNPPVLVVWLVAAALAGRGAVPAATRPTSRPGRAEAAGATYVAVLPFGQDFPDTSKTDETYGAETAAAVAAKWRRIPGYDVLDRYTVAEAMARLKVPRGDDAPIEKIRQLAKALAVDYVVYGAVRGAALPRQIALRVYDRRTGKPALNTQVPMRYWTDRRFIIERALSAVTGHTFYHPSEALAILDPASVAEWARRPNLVANGQFRLGHRGRLAGWEAVIAGKRYRPAWTAEAAAPIADDVTAMVLWSPAPGEPRAKVLQFAMPAKIGNTYGLACYSDWIAVEPGCRYRVAIMYRCEGVKMKPFIKGYAAFGGGGGFAPQRREVYRRQFPALGDTKGRWKTVVVDFVPSVLAPKPGQEPYKLKWVRVDLYTYLGAGRLYVKDVALKLVERPAAGKPVANPVDPVPAPRPPSRPAPPEGG